jgi:hypothetical protein
MRFAADFLPVMITVDVSGVISLPEDNHISRLDVLTEQRMRFAIENAKRQCPGALAIRARQA